MQGKMIYFNPVVPSGWSGNVKGKHVVTRGMCPQQTFPGVVQPRVPRAVEDWSGIVKGKQILTRGALPQYTSLGLFNPVFPRGDSFTYAGLL